MAQTRQAQRPPQADGVTFVRLVPVRQRHQRFTAGFLAVVMLFAVRLVQIQVIDGSRLAEQSASRRLATVTLPALRGSITDSSGVPLATSVMARTITTDQTKVVDPAGTAKSLARIVGLPARTLQDRLTGEKRYNIVATRVTPDTWKEVAALQLPGIYSEPTTTRVYPAGSLAASTLGFIGVDGNGLGGLEYQYDAELAGSNGTVTVERVNGREIPTSERQSVDPVNGQNIRLTIDRDIQALAERSLDDRIKQTGANGGDIIVMDVATGNILAMATYPTYDPAKPGKSSTRAKRNEAVTDSFEPGSTSKVITMAAVIEERAATPSTKFTVPPKLKRAGTVFTDHDPHPELHLTLNGVLAQSSNIGSILAAELIGPRKFMKYVDRFGLGQSTGLNFPGESPGIIPRPGTDSWSGTSFPTLAFGQGLSVTALQATSVFATIANDGVRMTPRLVEAFEGPDGSVRHTPASKGERVVSATTAKTVREMMESVVSTQGTAPAAQIPGYRVAGKTGTANRYDDNSGKYDGYTASFIGFAPAEDPQIVVAVMIHNPVNGHFGSTVSGPVFRKVMMYALAQRKIPPSTTKRPSLKVDW